MKYSRLGLVLGISLVAAITNQDFALAQRRGGVGAPGVTDTQAFRIQGKVVDDQKKPVIVVVRLTPENEGANLGFANSTVSTQSFSNGTFFFDNVKQGLYVVHVADARYLMKDIHIDLREPEDFGREITIVLDRNDGTAHGPGPLPADLSDLDKLDLPKLQSGTSPAAFDEFAKGIQDVRLGGKQTVDVVAANGTNGDTAEAHFKKALALDGNFYEALVQLGQEQRRQHHDADAIQTLEQATAKNPTDSRPLRALGALYVDQKQFQKASEVLIKAGPLTTLDATDRFNLGIAFENLNNPGAAQQQLQMAITLMPGRNPQAYLHLHNAYVQLNRLEDAAKTLEDFVRLFPNDPNRKTAEDRIKKLRAAAKKQPW
jgi:Flp pilus assembly protein TadD